MNIHSDMLEVLAQLLNGPVWDGSIISKASRNAAVDKGYAYHVNGFAFLSPRGVQLLDDLGLMKRG